MRPLVGGLLMVGLGAFFLAGGVAHAEIYRCVDRQGHALFTDAPCPKGMRTTSATSVPAACTTCAEDEQRARQEAERQQLAAIQSQMQRIRELEDELAALRGAPPPAPVPAAVQEEVPAAAPVYPIVVVVNRCHGRDCGHGHDGHGSHGHGDGRGAHDGVKVPVRRPPPSNPQH